MASLDRNLRKDLENAVKKARRVAEAGARQSIEQLAVHHHEPWGTLSPEQRQLRNRLRAHCRQLGDRRDERKGTQAIDRLVGKCAYEHWHRLLFARFLAENDLLVEPNSSMPLSLDECRELARERGLDWLVLASDFAQRMLPQIFRTGDPVLEVTLPPEKRQELEALLEALPRDVFVADDSLGWVYQFWQAEQKDAVNRSETKIGADELPAVTQLFTEDYMVLFLLHNTLGAWWAGKVLAARPELARTAGSEDELRRACALPGVDWAYLRFVKEDEAWRPAAATFDGWPKAAKDITVLDPCMGSGHFIVSALPILVALRVAQEKYSRVEAVIAVLRDNLFGLELDQRCTQIAVFNLAMATWRTVGHRPLPRFNLACCGLAINASEESWIRLAGDDRRDRAAMKQLYELFQQAPTIGSLINPRSVGGDLFVAEFAGVRPMLDRALALEHDDELNNELAVVARGIAQAADALLSRFTLVITNVPYLLRRKQAKELHEYCVRQHSIAKGDLATCFVQRCVAFAGPESSVALVTPSAWLYLGGFTELRKEQLRFCSWNAVARLGARAFETISGEMVNVSLAILTHGRPSAEQSAATIDTSAAGDAGEKASVLLRGDITIAPQQAFLSAPDARISLQEGTAQSILQAQGWAYNGQRTGDASRFVRNFWELAKLDARWVVFAGTASSSAEFTGNDSILLWEDGEGQLARFQQDQAEHAYASGGWKQGWQAWGRMGVRVSQMGDLPVTLNLGFHFDVNTSVIVPKREDELLAIWCFCSSPEFAREVRNLDQSLKVTNATLVKVPLDIARWTEIAGQRYPDGLPEPTSPSPADVVFIGRPQDAVQAVHVAVARLLGFQWPRQGGSSFLRCPMVPGDELEALADTDGIVCLLPLKGEPAAADRLRAMLAVSFGAEWSAAKLNQLLESVACGGKTLEEWLRESFFEQHCELFHQRPFVWHIWDGLKNGFAALVNYHKLAAPHGEGRRTLEKLIYTYLGDWLDRQRADQKTGIEGTDARVAAAEHLKRELETILQGEPPYDIFVRWKPLHHQPICWEPDLDDGVRINIRPFMTAKPLSSRGRNACILRMTPRIKWDKDRGKEPKRLQAEYPWFWGWDEQTTDFPGGAEFDGSRWNDLHYSRGVKLAARERRKLGGKS